MLIEWLKYWLSAADRNARQLGYLHEAIAIESRFRRVSDAWIPHIENCKKAVITSVRQCQARRHVIVLGAGSLIDVPVDFLSHEFDHVHLVDIVYTIGTRRRLSRYPNVSAIEYDISGLHGSLMDHDCAEDLPIIRKPQIPSGNMEISLIISMNLLSQLPVVPRAYLEQHCRYRETDLDAWCSELVRKHVCMLKQSGADVCLVSDVRHELFEAGSERLLDTEDRLYGMDPGCPQQEWIWNLAPAGEIARNYALRAVVQYHHWQHDSHADPQ